MSSYGKKMLIRLIISILSVALIVAIVLFIVFKLNQGDNEQTTQNYFDYPKSDNVVED